MVWSDRKLLIVLEPPDCLQILLDLRETALDAVHQAMLEPTPGTSLI